jgi:hypothetical protein
MKPIFVDLQQFNVLIKNKSSNLIKDIYPKYFGYPADDLTSGLQKYLDEIVKDWVRRNNECDGCLHEKDDNAYNQKQIRTMLDKVVKKSVKTLYVILKDILPDITIIVKYNTKMDITYGLIMYLTTLSHQTVTNIEKSKLDYPGYNRTGLISGHYRYDINFLLYGENSEIKVYNDFITSYIEVDDG